jgi:hypothetical protein
MSSKTSLAFFALLLYCKARADLPPSGEAITISQLPDFQNARRCVQSCVWWGGADAAAVAPQQVIGCSINSCLCRPDLQPTALFALTSCLGPRCDNAFDFSSGIAIYTNYCNSYRATAAPYPSLVTTAQSTSVTLTASPAGQPGQVQTVTQTVRSSSTAPTFSSSDSMYSTSEWAYELRLCVALTILFSIILWI